MNEDDSSSTSSPPSPPLSPARPEVMPMPPLPRPLPSRTSRRPSPPERSRPSRVCSHRSTIWREDSVSCNLLSQFSRTPSRPSRRSLMSEEWERNEHHELLSFSHDDTKMKKTDWFEL